MVTLLYAKSSFRFEKYHHSRHHHHHYKKPYQVFLMLGFVCTVMRPIGVQQHTKCINNNGNNLNSTGLCAQFMCVHHIFSHNNTLTTIIRGQGEKCFVIAFYSVWS